MVKPTPFTFPINLFVKVYSLYSFMDIVMDTQKNQGDTQLDLLLQHLPPRLQVLRSSTARSWGEMPVPWRGSLDEPPKGNIISSPSIAQLVGVF